MRHQTHVSGQFRLTTLAMPLAMVLAIFCGTHIQAQQEASVSGPVVGSPVRPHVITGRQFRELPRSMVSESKREVKQLIIADPKLPFNVKELEDQKMLSVGREPSMLGSTPAPAQFSNPNPNFLGILENGLVPPDTNGAPGPNHYIQIVNTEFAIWDKQGNLLSGGVHINQLWSSVPNDICFKNDNGDPVVLYDSLADRWVISQFAVPNGFQGRPTAECVAVSRTGDPVVGGWFLYDFALNINHDYPKMAAWPDAYYLTSQQGYSGGALNAIALDRTKMLAGNAAGFQAFTVAAPTVILLPSDVSGPAPPAGTPNFLVRPIDGTIFGGSDRIEIYAFHVDWAIPANSTVTLFNTLTPAAFNSGLCSPGSLFDDCIPQPGTSQLLESLNVWPMGPLQYRSFGGFETLAFAHTVNAGTSTNPVAGMRWYQLQRSSGGNWSINQQQTFSPDSTFRWMGSVAMDQAGDMALGYSGSSSSLLPEIRYVGRLSTDPLSQMTTNEITLTPGLSAQTTVDRWGDYSAMRVDPADNCTFWYTNEFLLGGGNSGLWGTQVGAFRFPTCNPADLAITKTGPATATAGKDVTYTISITDNGPSNATNLVLTDTLPAGVFLGVITGPNSASCNLVASTLTCHPGNLANGGSITYTITVHIPSGGVGSSSITNTANITSDQFDPNTANNTSSVTTNIVFVADLAITKVGSPNPAAAGTNVTYTIGVSNAGPSDANNVVVTDTLPAGVNFVGSSPFACTGTTVLTCNLGTLVSGGATSFVVVVKIPANYLSSRGLQTATITNTAKVTSAATDPNPGNNTASFATKVIEVADLDLRVTARPNPVHEGGNITYTMTFVNLGPSDAVRGVILQYFPAGFQFVGSTIEPCGTGGTDVLCRLGDVPAGFGLTFQVTYKIPSNFLGSKTSQKVHSEIRISSQSIDPDPIDSTVELNTTVIR
jgi:uncharacterized repeat protein (TIGR01451 family)